MQFRKHRPIKASAKALSILQQGEAVARAVLTTHVTLAAKIDGVPEGVAYQLDATRGEWVRVPPPAEPEPESKK